MADKEFVINGVSRTTGHQSTLRIWAADEKAAEEQAVQRGVNVLTVEPATTIPGQRPFRPDDPDAGSSSSVGTFVLGLLVLIGVGLVLYVAPSLYGGTRTYFSSKTSTEALDKQLAPTRQAVLQSDLLVRYGIALGGLALTAVPGMALLRRMRGDSGEASE